ncbi:DUF1538 domain-containing protein [Eubacteriales bacterium OttesenSCG-928-M02]|nr:DUF1538 domain-containing protein [Eubacteriales bacterium OttesenSCG-928-M02]
MNKILKEKITEAFQSVLPITIIVLVLSIFLVPMDIGTIAMFLVGAALLILGMGLFTLGADTAMMPLGEGVGVQLTQSKKLIMVILISFLMGFIITIAEPDLTVLANQVPSIPNMVLILTVAVGVGLFLVFAVLRILFRLSLSISLIIFYGILFAVSAFVPGNFLAVAFDAGGVTTGPITVPFIMSLGVGLASLRSDKSASEDSFGLVALSSIGPILSVLILGIFYNPSEASYVPVEVAHVDTTRDVARLFAQGLPHYAKEVLLALLPVIMVFLLFQLFTKRFHRREFIRMCVGFAYTILGLILFLTGVNVGFIAVGHLFGSSLASTNYSWVLIPIGMLVGYFVVAAEPAVHVLNKQVEDVSDGAIPASAMSKSLSIGVGISVALSMVRVLTGISIYWMIIPGYAIALLLTFFTPKIFVGIAFDSGGVASGPMATTFLLPMAMGACEALGGNVLTDAFGIVAMVALTPLITIQIMGIVFRIKAHKKEPASTLSAQLAAAGLADDMDIIDFDEADEDFIDIEQDGESEEISISVIPPQFSGEEDGQENDPAYQDMVDAYATEEHSLQSQNEEVERP